ncbi:hypothetical protein MNV49_000256 [Pseudohyphozyma bogoriensis]|nr:hypothetical protein MNV49_000256 [Pseudohyphozyma bogoriensis]
MGLFSKNSTSKSQGQKLQRQSQQQQQYQPSYAPPPGPPPSSSGQQYAGGYHPSQPQQQGQNQGYYAPPQIQQYGQQQYQQPPGPPPPHLMGQPAAGGRTGGREDPLAQLAKFDTYFLIDDSESMEMFWDELSSALQSVIAKAVQFDSDGVDIAFFNNLTKATSKSADELFRLFRRVEPRKSTPTASALKRVLEPYMSDLENWKIEGQPTGYPRPKPLNLIVLTDGAPDKGEDPEPIIVDIAKRLDAGRFPPYQIGIQFVQIGVDDEAADHLRALDDDLKSKHGIRDFVDTVLFDVKNQGVLNEQYIIKALLGSMNRSIDKQAV